MVSIYNQLTLSDKKIIFDNMNGLIQFVEGLRSKNGVSQKKANSLLLACPIEFELTNSLNSMSQFLKILSSAYHLTVSYRLRFAGEPTYRCTLLLSLFQK